MQKVHYVIVAVNPSQEMAYVKSVSVNGNFKTVKDKKKAKAYRNEDAVMYDLDLLANYVIQGYNFYYELG